MATKDIKIKNVHVTFPKIVIGRKDKNDRHKKRQEKSVPEDKQS